MTKEELKQMQEDIKIQDELKEFINDPKDFDFHHGSGVNEYKGDMHKFTIHAQDMVRDMVVAHAKYLINKIDLDLESKGITQ